MWKIIGYPGQAAYNNLNFSNFLVARWLG